VSFNVAADAYDRFMGRYSTLLAPQFADYAGVGTGQRVLDVGCGPGALTAELVGRLDATDVCAIDPSESFVEAIRDRMPEVTVRLAPAEQIPFEVGAFDIAMAQLVVHFMTDPVAGLREMARVTRSGGVVAACVWDHAGGKGPLSLFWSAVRQLDPDATTESALAGTGQGHLAQLFGEAGLNEIKDNTLSISTHHQTFEEWWEPYTLGVGPVGTYVNGLDQAHRDELRELCRNLLPAPPFELTAQVWAVRAVV
jgi:ubiquinone/menaquinone biosynthesis C-methylase UbiE